MTQPSKYNVNNPEIFQVIEENTGNVVGKYVKEQNLVEAAVEIQQLLDRLIAIYSVETEAERVNAIKDIQQKPELQGRIVKALEKGGKKAIEKLVDHPAASIAIAVYEGFKGYKE